MAAAYIVMGVLTRRLSPIAAAELDGLVYRLIALAAVFTAAGTMFGGFWADRVWGRFWGWDPKENAALLIVIWTAIYLLVRRNQLAGERIRMTLAASGTILACVSWLGVNMMGVGLHSYGFIRQELGWLMLLLASQMVIVGLSLVPQRYWRSPQAETDDPRELDALQTPQAGSPFPNPALVGRAPGPAAGRS
jgi:cytochrome c biogenesis factor